MNMRAVNLTDEQLDLLLLVFCRFFETNNADHDISTVRALYAAKSAAWQSEPPTEDGAYWWWEHETHEPRIVHVVKTPDPTIRAVRSGTWVLFLLPKWNRGQWWPIPIVMPPI